MDAVTLGMAKGSAARLYAEKPDTFVMAGDSITDAASFNGGRTFWAWGENFTKKRMKVIRNAGIGGNTTAQLVARFQTDVLAYDSGWVHILIGRNDLADTTDGGFTNVSTGIVTLVQRSLRAGRKVVVGTVIPSNGITANQENGRSKINQFIRALPETYPVHIVDYSAALLNPATNSAISSAFYDGATHPGMGGAAIMGKALADAITPYLRQNVNLLDSASNTASTNLLVRGRFPDAGVGAPATSWTESVSSGGARTYSKVARTDIQGNWQRVVVPASGTLTLVQNVNVGALLAINDQVWFEFEYQASGSEQGVSSQYVFASLAAYNGSAFGTEVFDCQYASGAESFLRFDRSGVYKTPLLTVPSGSTLIQARIQISKGVTLDLDRAAVRKAI